MRFVFLRGNSPNLFFANILNSLSYISPPIAIISFSILNT